MAAFVGAAERATNQLPPERRRGNMLGTSDFHPRRSLAFGKVTSVTRICVGPISAHTLVGGVSSIFRAPVSARTLLSAPVSVFEGGPLGSWRGAFAEHGHQIASVRQLLPR